MEHSHESVEELVLPLSFKGGAPLPPFSGMCCREDVCSSSVVGRFVITN